nr:PREDICTED: glutaredoxin domain-containing cysteine-rich protein 2 isoform X1 [Lepisosteus oculatus]
MLKHLSVRRECFIQDPAIQCIFKMDELQIKLNQRFEGKPRKVRFKIASSYSGRVLKHVYEDGQELESPEDEYPHSFIHGKLPKHLEVEQLYGFGELREPELFSPPPLMAERINVYRGGKYSLTGEPSLFDDPSSVSSKPSSVLDFGKIIIYTSNLRIIRSPWVKKASTKSSLQNRDGTDRDSRTDEGGKEGQDYVHGVLGEDQSNKTANSKVILIHTYSSNKNKSVQQLFLHSKTLLLNIFKDKLFFLLFTTYLSTVSTFSRSRVVEYAQLPIYMINLGLFFCVLFLQLFLSLELPGFLSRTARIIWDSEDI